VLIGTGSGTGEFEDAATIGHNFEAVIADLETRMREAATDATEAAARSAIKPRRVIFIVPKSIERSTPAIRAILPAGG
jgi:excinuclease ABC subunit B